MPHKYDGFTQAVRHYEQQEFETSLGLLNELIDEIPGFADAYGIRGITLTALGQHEEALKNFAQCRTLRPRMWTTDWYESSTLKLLGRDEEASLSEGRARAIYNEVFLASA